MLTNQLPPLQPEAVQLAVTAAVAATSGSGGPPFELYDKKTINVTLGMVSITLDNPAAAAGAAPASAAAGGPTEHSFVDSVRFVVTKPDNGKLFASIHHLWACIRDQLYKDGYSTNLPIKNAHRYADLPNTNRIPCIQDAAAGLMLFDPLHVFRNPCVELYKGRSITLLTVPSRSAYYAPTRVVKTAAVPPTTRKGVISEGVANGLP